MWKLKRVTPNLYLKYIQHRNELILNTINILTLFKVDTFKPKYHYRYGELFENTPYPSYSEFNKALWYSPKAVYRHFILNTGIILKE